MPRKRKSLIVGIDEAGRGPWAGPVVAAAALLGTHTDLSLLRDSKKTTPAQREHLYSHIITTAEVHIGIGSVEIIDTHGIKHATHMAMSHALAPFIGRGTEAQVDGNDQFSFDLPSTSIIRGDATVPAISAASIVAKVFRDRLMELYHSLYPQYGFHQHKGYGTPVHTQQLSLHGPCPIHRKSFKPIALLYSDGQLQ